MQLTGLEKIFVIKITNDYWSNYVRIFYKSFRRRLIPPPPKNKAGKDYEEEIYRTGNLKCPMTWKVGPFLSNLSKVVMMEMHISEYTLQRNDTVKYHHLNKNENGCWANDNSDGQQGYKFVCVFWKAVRWYC